MTAHCEGPNLDDRSDETLLDLYFLGDADAFLAFFERHSRRVMAYGRSKGLSQEDAQDFAQEVFMKLHKNIHLYEKGRPALPWFFTLVHHVVVDQIRKQARARLREMTSEGLEELPDPSDGHKSEAGIDMWTDKLTVDQRNIVELRVMEELSFRDISNATGRTEVASRKIFERAMKVLRKLAARED